MLKSDFEANAAR